MGNSSLPKLKWLNRNADTLWGNYDEKLNEIRISRDLKKAPPWVLSYILFHEMLHWQLSTDEDGRWHGKRFKELLAEHPGHKQALIFLERLQNQRQRRQQQRRSRPAAKRAKP